MLAIASVPNESFRRSCLIELNPQLVDLAQTVKPTSTRPDLWKRAFSSKRQLTEIAVCHPDQLRRLSRSKLSEGFVG